MTIQLRPTRRRRPLIAVPLLSVLILVGGWSALWFFARTQAIEVMDRWLAREAQRDRIFTCPDRDIGGFPLGITISCAHPTFRVRVGGTVLEGSLAGLQAGATLFEPSAVDAVAQGPAALHKADPDDGPVPPDPAAPDPIATGLTWDNLHFNLRILTPELTRFVVEIDNPAWTRADGQGGSARRFELHVGPAAGRPPEDHADDIWLTLSQAAIPALDGLTGSADRIDADEKAIVDHLAFGDTEPGPAMAEAWRQAGGAIELKTLVLAKGALQATASGRLALDDQHRPTGRLDMGLAGFEALARQFGLPLRTLSIGGALAHLLNAGAPAAADPGPAGPDAVRLPLTLADGHVSIGPIRTPLKLPPLY